MRILRIHSWDGQRGGAEDYIRAVCDELERRGHENRVVGLVNVLPEDARAHEKYRVVPASGAARWFRDLLDEAEVRSLLLDTFREFDPDIVQLHHFDAAFTTVGKVLRELPAPLVFTAHDAELVCPISTLVRPGNVVCEGGIRVRCLFTGCAVGWGGVYNLWQRELFDRWVAPRVRAYLCPSLSLTRYLDTNGYRPAIHLPSFARIPAEVRAAEPPAPSERVPPTVGYLGRLEPYKGVHDLIEAVALLAARYPDLRLDIAGDGPFRPELEALARRRGVASRIVWRGAVRGEAKEAWFRDVRAVATPSNLFENFPLVALEALARARPVVGTDIGGIPDIVEDRVTGRLAPIADPPALAEAIADTLDHPARARAWAREGRRRVLERFTPERHVERLLAVYRAVLRGERLESGSEAQALVGAAAA